MPELTDDQLDGLFRKSAEEFDPPFDPAAWQDMKLRLDANDRTMPSSGIVWKNLLRWGLPVALLLLLTGGGWYVYRQANPAAGSALSPTGTNSGPALQTTAKGVHQSETPRLAENDRPNMTSTRSSEPDAIEVDPSTNRVASADADAPGKLDNRVDKSAKKLTETTIPTGSKATKRAGIETSPIVSLARPKATGATKSVTSSYKLPSGQTRTNRSRFTPIPIAPDKAEMTTNRLSRHSTSKDRVFGQKQRTARRDLVAFSATQYAMSTRPSITNQSVTNRQKTTPPDGSITAGNTTSSASNEAPSVLLPTVTELAIRPAHWPKSLSFTGRPVEVQPDTTSQRVVPKPPVQRGLSVRFVVAPDLSSVGLKNFSRPGTNVGLLLEYRLASRWSIQAGVIQSTKVYKAQAADYGNVPYDVKNQHAVLEGIDGRCNMLDIPINVRYDISLRPRLNGQAPSRWFVSGGVTTYIMKQEDYDYKYLYPALIYPTTPLGRSDTTGAYGFSQLNFSVGYERSISRRLSWQVEPFLKAPLKGVGFFNVHLLSTGVFFSLRYKL